VKILCVGGPFDGRRITTDDAKGTIEVPAPSLSGPVKHKYSLSSITMFGRTWNIYVHSNLTPERMLDSLIERYPKGE
jgi:hypothetical protein